MRNQRAKVVYLGTFRDMAEVPASFFWDIRKKRLLGPLDHQRFKSPKSKIVRRPGRVPKSLKPGTVGYLDYRYLAHRHSRKAGTYGFYSRFRKGKATKDIRIFAKQIKSPFVIGLLTGRYAWPLTSSWLSHIKFKTLSRPNQGKWALGILYGARSWREMPPIGIYKYRDMGGAYLTNLLMLRAVGLKGIAKRKITSTYHWTDILPLLAQQWLAKKKDKKGFDQFFLKRLFPILPAFKRFGMYYPQLRQCPPYRWERHGPFQMPEDFRNHTIWHNVAKKYPAFATFTQKMFADVYARKDAFVANMIKNKRGHFALLLDNSSWYMVNITKAQYKTLAIGNKLNYVVRGKEVTTFPFQPAIPLRMLFLQGRMGRFLYNQKGRDIRAFQKRLVSHLRLGNTTQKLGFALQNMHSVAVSKQTSWTLQTFRQELHKFSGNTYRNPNRTVSGWLSAFEYAIQTSTHPSLPDELMKALPLLYRHAKAASDKKTKWDAHIMHLSVVRFVTAGTFFWLVQNKPNKAHRWLKTFDAEKSKFYPKRFSTSISQKSNAFRMLRALRALVAKANKKPFKLQGASRQDEYVLRLMFQMYRYEIKERFVRLLHKAGYQKISP